MRNWQIIPPLLLWSLTAPSQTVTLIPDIGVAQVEYHDALESSLRSDPDLEKDLPTGEPGQMHRRVQKAAEMRDDVLLKKQKYLDLMVQRLRDTRAVLAVATSGEIPVADLRKDLEAQHGRMLGDQERLEEFLRDLPEGDEYLLVRRALEAERESLINLQNTIALRIHSLDSLDKTQDGIRKESQGATDAQRLDELLNLWNQERLAVTRQRTLWANLYKSMERAIDERTAAQRNGVAVAPGNSQKPSGVSRKQVPAAARTTVANKIVGTWVYRRQTGSWSGVGEPEMVTLELHYVGGTLRGTYFARLPAPGGMLSLQLALSGPSTVDSAVRLHWTSQSPQSEGELDLSLGADGSLLVRRVASGDTAIPPGTEVLTLP
jgi:hypothetical protein